MKANYADKIAIIKAFLQSSNLQGSAAMEIIANPDKLKKLIKALLEALEEIPI